MCDTMVAIGNSTADGSVLFAKNSDREPNETHELITIPRLKHSHGDSVRCTYIRIPQVRETFAAFLAKPFWIWGAEMGINEHGVAIGRTMAAATRLHSIRNTDERCWPLNMYGLNVCMHFGVGPNKSCQTTGSMISKTRPGKSAAIWATCSSLPCMSIYKPIWIESGLPGICESRNGCYDDGNFWWLHETLNRKRIYFKQEELRRYRTEMASLEGSIIDPAQVLKNSSLTKRELTDACFEKERDLLLKWNSRVRLPDHRKLRGGMLARKTERLNREAERAVVRRSA